ncbi:outer membrane beta-barrel protein [Ferrovum sp.]|jgi:OOP family OmpA-OmpF porin|uniref:outer membrane protein n=1 Tax=Ferrovum sp. TaxID=2609467 RepID=UPI00262C27A7|nr:outer membrane beta-barrel protein [Ferrovum sp.]MBW8066822.1 outer membrane beta-barrel protein [Ferrovum sp.]
MKKIALTLAFLLPSGAYAQGLYIGGTMGEAQTLNASNQAAWNNSSYNSVFGALIGYQFNRYFGVEGAYSEAGEFGNNAVSGKTDVATLEGVGYLPLSNVLSLYGKLGVGSATTQSVSSARPGYSGANRISSTYGLGLQFNINAAFSARFGYDYYRSALNTPDGTADFGSNAFTVGALYHF